MGEIAQPEEPRSRRTLYWLCGALCAVLAEYAALYYTEIYYVRASASIATASPAAEQPVARAPAETGPAAHGEARAADAAARDEVVQALRWLARKSLADYRLTDPGDTIWLRISFT